MSFKSIYVNTYTVMMVNLETQMIVFKHESPHLFETSIRCLMLKSDDLIMFSHNGIFILNIGMKQKTIEVGTLSYRLHSVHSCNDLHLEPTNHLKFQH